MVTYGEYGMFEVSEGLAADVVGAYNAGVNALCGHPRNASCVQVNAVCHGSETNTNCLVALDAQCTGSESNSSCAGALNGKCVGSVNAVCPTNAMC
jgi:hypothetical protein